MATSPQAYGKRLSINLIVSIRDDEVDGMARRKSDFNMIPKKNEKRLYEQVRS